MTKFANALLSLRLFFAFNLHLDKWSTSLLLRKGNVLLLLESSCASPPYFVDGEPLFEPRPIPDERMAYGSYASSSSNELSFELLLLTVPYVDAPWVIDFFSAILAFFLSFTNFVFTRRFYEYEDSLFMLNYIYTRSIDDVRTTTILLFTLSAFVGVNEVRVLLLIYSAEMIKEIGRGLFFFYFGV